MKIDTAGVSYAATKAKEPPIDRGDLTGGFGAVISELRKKKGLRQEDLSKLVGLYRTSISNIESGRQKISALMLLKIIDALGLEMQISFKDKTQKPTSNVLSEFGPAFGLTSARK